MARTRISLIAVLGARAGLVKGPGSSLALGTALLCGLACTGSIADNSSLRSGARGAGTENDPVGSGPAGGPVAIGPDGKPVLPPSTTVVRRLSRTEYNNTVRDLLGDTTHPAADFLVDETKLGFDNIAEAQTTSPVRAEQYMLAGEKLAATAGAELLAKLPCAAAGGAACAAQFIGEFGQRAYRRPLSEAEATRLLSVFQQGSSAGGFKHGIELALRLMLSSPSFLFRVELGQAGQAPAGLQPLSPWEMASRLSYLLLGTMPDSALFQAAGESALGTKAQIKVQAERLVNDPRAKANIAHLQAQWLDLGSIQANRVMKDAKLFPNFNNEVLQLAKQETETFVDDVVWNAQDGVKALLTGNYSFMNDKLATFYGVTGPAGAAFEKVQLDPARRSGLLTQVGILARYAHQTQTAPTLRGKFVRERLLCNLIPPPPPTVNAKLPDPTPTTNARERSAHHLADPSCKACHDLLDPIGLGFEHYDAVGAWQEQDGGKPVDTSGFVNGAEFSGGQTGSFNGVPELATKLAASPDVRACITKQWFRFAYGREETPADAGVLSTLDAALSATGNFRELLLSLTQTDAFMYRTPAGSP